MRELTEEEAFQVLAFMEKLVVGLDQLDSHYQSNEEDLAWALHQTITPKVFKEAAQIRQMLCSKYNQELVEGQDQDEVEQLLVGLDYWKVPTPKQVARFRNNRLKK